MSNETIEVPGEHWWQSVERAPYAVDSDAGVYLGTYMASGPDDALDACAREAGYEDYMSAGRDRHPAHARLVEPCTQGCPHQECREARRASDEIWGRALRAAQAHILMDFD